MTFSRYEKRSKTFTILEDFRQQENSNEINSINHYVLSNNIIDKTRIDFQYSEHEWKYGDKLYKIAHKFYGDSKLWWIIAHVNMKPTDSHYEPGDVLIIPNSSSLSKVIKMLGY